MTCCQFPSLAVLVAPHKTMASLVSAERDSTALFGMLALEAAIVYPRSLVGAFARMSESPAAGLSALVSVLVQHMLVPVAGIFAMALVVSRLGRWWGRHIPIGVAAAVYGYAWSPHTVLTAVGKVLALLGLDSPLLPHHLLPLASPGVLAVRTVIVLAPTLGLWGLGTRQLWRGRRDAVPAEESLVPRRLWISPAGLLAFAMLAAVAGRWLPRQVASGAGAASQALPEFTLHGLDGPSLRSSDLPGSVVVIDFWATWCPPCLAAMPHLERLHQELATQGLRVVSINIEADERDRVREFIAKHHLTFAVYVDSGSMQRAFAVTSYPTMVVADRQGHVRKTYRGAVPFEDLRATVVTLLAQ
jgi:thiol-disulfide isomerase/thioredoxin